MDLYIIIINFFTDLWMVKIVCETSTLEFIYIIGALSRYAFFFLLCSFSPRSEKNVPVQLHYVKLF